MKILLATVVAALAASVGTANAATTWTANAWQSPTRNIICRANRHLPEVSCMTRNDGFTVQITDAGKGTRFIRYSVSVPTSSPRLGYGKRWHGSWSGGARITCLSQRRGMTCTNRYGHGFFLERHTYKVW